MVLVVLTVWHETSRSVAVLVVTERLTFATGGNGVVGCVQPRSALAGDSAGVWLGVVFPWLFAAGAARSPDGCGQVVVDLDAWCAA